MCKRERLAAHVTFPGKCWECAQKKTGSLVPMSRPIINTTTQTAMARDADACAQSLNVLLGTFLASRKRCFRVSAGCPRFSQADARRKQVAIGPFYTHVGGLSGFRPSLHIFAIKTVLTIQKTLNPDILSPKPSYNASQTFKSQNPQARITRLV